ncbi:DHS-like NAD/FAD-binding domain-containing protein [Collybia nuda]|uniref:DHS-like NAD/FAD-binding domain-containing protein n=1 Tax=Collybia nuda TaxID=64659 RepID=A0A9P6CHU6_9AGAR|nr:DHS-like NAD/FAD-binding domain-containing protein [Collybia nuda]
MTLFLPLEASTPLPPSPSFLIQPTDSHAQVSKVIKAIMKAKRIVVICGAGISVRAGIPDFRSPEGLFKTLKRDNPREALASGKDLFDASVFNSEHTTSLFCQMIAQLSGLSHAAEPTAFHRALRALDDRGKLLRVYTQNIDAIERKCGLSFGVPEFEEKRGKGRSKNLTHPPPTEADGFDPSTPETKLGSPSCPPGESPRCIPLHGTLQMLHCQICTRSFPLEDHLESLVLGQPPPCPECISMEETRQLVGKRARGIGRLRPSVVLYNEAHKDGEGVGEVVRKDLVGSSKGKGRSGADLLLVVGTSLRVPGTKRMVREFAKAVRSRGSSSSNAASGSSNPPSPRRSPSNDEEPATKAIYLNLDFPVPTREWEGVFDAWIQGDAQEFAEALRNEIEREAKAKEVILEKKKKRDMEMALLAKKEEIVGRHDNDVHHEPKPPKRKAALDLSGHTVKRRNVSTPPSPPTTPGNNTVQCTPHTPQANTSKLILRIPARPPRPWNVPEVYITTLPPKPNAFGKGKPPVTPESPPRTQTRHNKITKAGVRIERAINSVSKTLPPGGVVYDTPQPFEPIVATSDDDDDDDDDDQTHLLPQSFLRTVQYGLRAGAG